MILLDRRRQADAATVVLLERKHTFLARTRAFRAVCARHRAALIVGGGFAGGVLTSWMPIAPFVRLASAFASTLTLMIDGPVAGFLAGYRSRGTDATGAKAE
ncbi:MAG: hypothetical protein ACREPX_04055 [Rhodanobacteraceae bacterium]